MPKKQIYARDIYKGAFSGLVGGLVASFVMSGFQALWSKVSERKDERSKNKQAGGEKKEPTTVKAAEMISENVFNRELSEDEKKYAGPAMHYAMGGTSGLIYGVAAEVVPLAKTGAGIPFGAALWLIADDLTLPALGLSASPFHYPLSTHAYALSSHIVYGLTTEFVRDRVRNALD